eukprot:scaffold649_cov347-Pavlova_lutheri.AAC.134
MKLAPERSSGPFSLGLVGSVHPCKGDQRTDREWEARVEETRLSRWKGTCMIHMEWSAYASCMQLTFDGGRDGGVMEDISTRKALGVHVTGL